MAKKPPVEEQKAPDIIQASLEEVMHQSMMPYAEHVILERAIPRVEDGLKPVQRRILYTMQELGLHPDKPHRKCARIVGDCLGKYHPHGDSSVYDALARMAQPFSLRGILVDGHGNFGSIDGDGPAAMRYTEARMAPLAVEMLRDIEKDTVNFSLNFDDTLKEPDLLPARFPNLLVNGASGIAVGLATNIPPHNLREVTEAVCLQLDEPDISLDKVMKVLPAPDFPTGGLLLKTDEIRSAYETGRGKLTLRCRTHMEKGNAGRTLIVIDEIPYGISKSGMLEKILKLSEEKKGSVLQYIHDIRDESDRTGLRAVIEVKKDGDAEKMLKYLFKYSDMQVTFGVNLVAIAEGKPVQMGIREAIGHFIRHQKNVVTRRTQYELDQARARAHILEALIVAVDNLDEVIALIRASRNGKEARARLMERFGFDEVQAQAILDLRLQRLTGLEIETLRQEYADILKLITRLEGILKSEKKLIALIKKEVSEIAEQYGDDRRTTLIEPEEETREVEKEEAPLPEEAVVTLSRDGNLRRLSPRTFEKLDLPEDPAEGYRYLFHTQTDHTLYFFTDKGNCYPLSVGALQESKAKERGKTLPGLLAGLEKDEKCVKVLLVTPGSLNASGDLLFFTEQGQIKRSEAADYAIKRAKSAALTLKDGDKLINVEFAEDDTDLLFMTRNGQSIRFALDEVPVQGRGAAGVRAIKLDDSDTVLMATQIRNTDQILLFTERGYAKRLMGSLFDIIGRGGKGSRSVSFNKTGSTGSYVAALARVQGSRSFSVKQSSGMVTVLSTDDLPCLPLNDKGKPVVMALLNDIVEELIL